LRLQRARDELKPVSRRTRSAMGANAPWRTPGDYSR
jgi:hypothetical protein